MKKVLCDNIENELFKKSWKLYELSFPEEERRRIDEHQKALNDERFFPSLYCSEEGELLAICFYWQFEQFVYLEHLAVSLAARNRKVGTVVLSELAKNPLPIILEIDPPIDDISVSRLCFYGNNRFFPSGFDIKQLKYRKTDNDVCLKVLCNQKMDRDLFNTFKTTIYQELSPYCQQ